jgi:hypothetical protein
MTFGAKGYEPVELPRTDRTELTQETDFWQVRSAGRVATPEHYHERFITDFYQVVM